MCGELADFFLLHGVPEKDKGMYAYMALEDGPRTYVNAMLRAPVEAAEHARWVSATFRHAGGMEALSEVMGKNPQYVVKDNDMTKLSTLTELRVSQDGADFAKKFTDFSRLVSELRVSMGMSYKEELVHMLRMLSPYSRLYDKVSRKPTGGEWLAGEPEHNHPEVLAEVQALAFDTHRQLMQLRHERAALVGVGGHAGKRQQAPDDASGLSGKRVKWVVTQSFSGTEPSNGISAAKSDASPSEDDDCCDTECSDAAPSDDDGGCDTASDAAPSDDDGGCDTRSASSASNISGQDGDIDTDDSLDGQAVRAHAMKWRRKHKLCFACGATSHKARNCHSDDVQLARALRRDAAAWLARDASD